MFHINPLARADVTARGGGDVVLIQPDALAGRVVGVVDPAPVAEIEARRRAEIALRTRMRSGAVVGIGAVKVERAEVTVRRVGAWAVGAGEEGAHVATGDIACDARIHGRRTRRARA